MGVPGDADELTCLHVQVGEGVQDQEPVCPPLPGLGDGRGGVFRCHLADRGGGSGSSPVRLLCPAGTVVTGPVVV
jgi:hypothetical protein